jgi:hypothetical protein
MDKNSNGAERQVPRHDKTRPQVTCKSYCAEMQATAVELPDVFRLEDVEICGLMVPPHFAGTTGCGPVWTGLG